MSELRLILGDQLNSHHPWFEEVEDDVTFILVEARSETDYVKHHIQKVLGIFAAMRRFSKALKDQGHDVIYITLDDERNQGSITETLSKLIVERGYRKVAYQLPDEWRLDEALRSWCDGLEIEHESVDTHHFLTERYDLKEKFQDKKQILMERFYRDMRKKHGVLMDGDQPATGEWNYDASNRKKLPKDVDIPDPKNFEHDLTDLEKMVHDHGVETIGEVDAKHFIWPLDRSESQQLLKHFIDQLLPRFGDFQDALTDRGWSLFHSRLSFALNTKMLSPLEVIEAVEDAWRADKDRVDISQAEGYIRQILGWREFMRGVYWWKMPDYASMNFFEHERSLPQWYWTGDTGMACMAHAIKQSLNHAYAHHIQRLMITGNFALLAGCDPDEVDAWYLGIYIDAFEWVEITNTRGMSQFADGGIIGTKPYVSSASYIHKMGDHCKGCAYDHKKKTGEEACPFNSLYWHFHDRHREKLEDNTRIGMMYNTWDRMGASRREEYLEQAEKYLSEIDYL